MRMELINDAIQKLGASRKFNKPSRHNAAPSLFKQNNTKEEWLKAVEMQIDAGKSDRKRREVDSNNEKLKKIIDDFKKVRDSLYEEYEWKHYNLSDIWKKWDNTMQVARLPSDAFINNNTNPVPCTHSQSNCAIEIGATAATFGALILLAICVLKLLKKLNFSI